MSLLSEAQGADVRNEPVTALHYPDIAIPSSCRRDRDRSEGDESGDRLQTSHGTSAEELERLLTAARREGNDEAERRVLTRSEVELEEQATKIKLALEAFESERKEYFSQVETEVVRLTLSIAAKILHRESQVDPSVVAALVRVAIERMEEGSAVKLRVSATQSTSWRRWMGEGVKENRISIIEDAAISKGGCIVETSLGSADFSLEAQLKEVERGFFDLLALRP